MQNGRVCALEASVWLQRASYSFSQKHTCCHASPSCVVHRYVDYLFSIIDHDSQLLAVSRPTEAAAKAAAATAGSSTRKGKSPKGLSLPPPKGGRGGGSGGGGKSSSAGNNSSSSSSSSIRGEAAPVSLAAVRAAHAGDNSQRAQAAALRPLTQVGPEVARCI